MIMNFSDPSGGGGGVGSVLDSLKMSQQQLTPEQELKHQQQARKGIQTSPDGALHYYNHGRMNYKDTKPLYVGFSFS
jgi:hypothetical protein